MPSLQSVTVSLWARRTAAGPAYPRIFGWNADGLEIADFAGGGTSLLEGLLWGHRSARHIAASLEPRGAALFDDIPPWRPAIAEAPDPALVAQDVTSIKHIMWNYVGLVRTSRRLARAIRDLRNLEVEIERFYRAAKVLEIYEGTKEVEKIVIAREILGKL